MRLIKSTIVLTAEQASALSEGAAEVLASTDRSGYIAQNAKRWRQLRSVLESASGGKCWYCETARTRSDYAVDHFRPKLRVAECPAHPGYWWLAFDLSNFRLACTYCNERRVSEQSAGGKANHFPLVIESQRCMDQNGDISAEQPILLDPLNPKDPPLLKFLLSGDVLPRVPETLDAIQFRRAAESIRIFHLQETRLVRGRGEKIRYALTLMKAVNVMAEGIPLRHHITQQIRSMLELTGEHSGAIRDALAQEIENFIDPEEGAA